MLSPVVKQVFPQQGAHKLRLPQLFQPLQGGGKLPAGKGILLSLAFQRPDLPLQKGDAIGGLDALRRRAVPIFLHLAGIGVVVHRQDDLRLIFDAPGDHPGICTVPGADLLIDLFRSCGFFSAAASSS